jgi:hypothetical protein
MRRCYSILPQILGDWYLWICKVLKERFRERVQFWFFTDHKNPDCEEAIRRFNPTQFAQAGLTECSDLLLTRLPLFAAYFSKDPIFLTRS